MEGLKKVVGDAIGKNEYGSTSKVVAEAASNFSPSLNSTSASSYDHSRLLLNRPPRFLFLPFNSPFFMIPIIFNFLWDGHSRDGHFYFIFTFEMKVEYVVLTCTLRVILTVDTYGDRFNFWHKYWELF